MEYRRVWPDLPAARAEDVPYLHAGLFKHVLFKTGGEGIEHQRTLTSSSTSGADPSKIVLDRRSSELQAQSSLAILKDLVGSEVRPLIVLDKRCCCCGAGRSDGRALLPLGEVPCPLASEIHFVLDDSPDQNVNWAEVCEVFEKHSDVLIYGFTCILWKALGAAAAVPVEAATAMAVAAAYISSTVAAGKKLEQIKVGRAEFDAALLRGFSSDSKVIDYYGLVEQVGVIYPLCEKGNRHAHGVGRASDRHRDPWTMKPLAHKEGLLQLVNVLAWGAPYHSVLTEDLGRLVPGDCPCGRKGTRFELLGRLRAETWKCEACANV